MSVWRLLKSETNNAFVNMAVDEAIMQARIEEKAPNTLRFFRWNPSAVSIGRFQDIYNEVNLESCRRHGVDVVRRISGGGAVYHDSEDEITYSVIVKREDLGTNDVAEAYHYICNGLIEAAHILGVNATYNKGNIKQCPNITVKGRKISGSAQAHKKGVILQHGTLLINVDLEKMFTFLNVPWTDACVDLISVAKRKITSIANELGHRVSLDCAYEALTKGFEKALGLQLVEGNLSNHELNLTKKLKKEKFATYEWNFEGKTSTLSLKPVS
ncbi:MAG: biotin/lipoate A/B protein ligase family protein [Candidatus Bathyarchaeia archaeon]